MSQSLLHHALGAGRLRVTARRCNRTAACGSCFRCERIGSSVRPAAARTSPARAAVSGNSKPCPQPLSVQTGVGMERKNNQLRIASSGRKNGKHLTTHVAADALISPGNPAAHSKSMLLWDGSGCTAPIRRHPGSLADFCRTLARFHGLVRISAGHASSSGTTSN